jgi:hypothetical protein
VSLLTESNESQEERVGLFAESLSAFLVEFLAELLIEIILELPGLL